MIKNDWINTVLHAFVSNKVCRHRGGKAMKENTFLLSAVLAGIDAYEL